jgi:hypothetical protein
MVVGSLQRKRAMSLKVSPAFSFSAIYMRSSSVRCFWFPGIYLLIRSLLQLLSEGDAASDDLRGLSRKAKIVMPHITRPECICRLYLANCLLLELTMQKYNDNMTV